MKRTKIKFGFRSKTQTPFFMMWKEYWEGEEVVFAKVLFTVWFPFKAPKFD